MGIVIFGAAMSKSRENLQKSIINQLLNFKSLLKKPTHLYLFKQEKQSMSHFLKPFTVGRRRRRSNDSLQADDLRQIGKKNLNLHKPPPKRKKNHKSMLTLACPSRPDSVVVVHFSKLHQASSSCQFTYPSFNILHVGKFQDFRLSIRIEKSTGC